MHLDSRTSNLFLPRRFSFLKLFVSNIDVPHNSPVNVKTIIAPINLKIEPNINSTRKRPIHQLIGVDS
jgi:hypothetical protein